MSPPPGSDLAIPDPESTSDGFAEQQALQAPSTNKWLAVAILVLLLGLALELGTLVYAMYVLLAVLALSHLMTREWATHLQATRECSQATAAIGDKVAVIVQITNSGRWSVPWLLVEDSLPRAALRQKPPRLTIDGRRIALRKVAAGKTESLLYQVRFEMRGYYQIGPLLVESGDVFGLQRRFRVLTRPHFVLVYPRTVPLSGFDLMSRRPIGEVRITHRLFEDPTRVSGVRPYERGDPLNRIHWRVTARTGSLHCKTYEPSCVAGASLLLDFHVATVSSRTEPHKSELAVTTAASIAEAISLLDQQIGLYTNGRDAADRIRQEGWAEEFETRSLAREQIGMSDASTRLQPVSVETRRGSEQLSRIFELLARVELTDGLPFQELVSEVASRLPRDATVIAVLMNASVETALSLANLRKQGFAVTALLVMYPDEPDYTEAAGRLLQAGIDVRNVEDEATLAHVCSRSLQAGGLGRG